LHKETVNNLKNKNGFLRFLTKRELKMPYLNFSGAKSNSMFFFLFFCLDSFTSIYEPYNMLTFIQRTRACKGVPNYRSYSSTSNNGSFFYKYGTPLVKCTVLATSTTLAWQLLWQHLEYAEYRDEAENVISQLEGRIKSLEDQRSSQ
jgi:hypothetical protein